MIGATPTTRNLTIPSWEGNGRVPVLFIIFFQTHLVKKLPVAFIFVQEFIDWITQSKKEGTYMFLISPIDIIKCLVQFTQRCMANSQVALQGNTRIVLPAKELFKPMPGLFFLAEQSQCKYIGGDSLTRLIYFATNAISKFIAFFIVTAAHIQNGKISHRGSPIRIQFQGFQKLFFRFLRPAGSH